MNWIYALVSLAALLAVALLWCLSHKRQQEAAVPAGETEAEHFSFYKRSHLFSPVERLFFYALERAAGGQYDIFGKVRIADLLEVEPELEGMELRDIRNDMVRRHVDFVLCNRDTFTLVAAINLDHYYQSKTRNRAQDSFTEKAFAAAGFPLLVFPAKPVYDSEELRVRITEAVEASRSAEKIGGPSDMVGPTELAEKKTNPLGVGV